MVRLIVLAAALLCAAPAHASTWVTAWATPMQGRVPTGYQTDAGTLAALTGGLSVDRTLRLVVRPSIAGDAVRVRLSAEYARLPLRIGAASVGVAGAGAAVAPGTLRPLTFAGAPAAEVPVGSALISDPVALPVARGSALTVSIHIPLATELSWHATAFATGWVAAGDHTGDEGVAAFPLPITSTPLLERVDVLAADGAGTVVALGDSATDGAGVRTDANERWTDALAARLGTAGIALAVANSGINGNNVGDRGIATDGPCGLCRFDRDVLGATGVRAVIVWEGSNDLSNNATAEALIADVTEAVRRARAAGLRVLLGTAMPRSDWRWTAAMETERQAFNAWVRTQSIADGVIDADRVVRDAAGALDPRYDSGDHLHPNGEGYALIAAAVPLAALAG